MELGWKSGVVILSFILSLARSPLEFNVFLSNLKLERVKGIESIRDHRPVSSETGVISHKSTCNTRFAFCPARSKTTLLRRSFVIRSHTNARNKTPLTRGKLHQASVPVLALLEAVPELRGEQDLGAINQDVARKFSSDYRTWIKLDPFALQTGQVSGGAPNSMSPQTGHR
jgi:hypothetical protein